MMNSQLDSDLCLPSNYDFEDFFDKLGIIDKSGYDINQIATPPPSLFESNLESEDDFLSFNIPEISDSNPSLDSRIFPNTLESYDPSVTSSNYNSHFNQSERQSCNTSFSSDFDPPLFSQNNGSNSFDLTTWSSDFGSGGTCEVNSNLSHSSMGNFSESYSNNDYQQVGCSSDFTEPSIHIKKKGNAKKMTEEEKYIRIRDQNNESSRQYRSRKKTKQVGMEEKLGELMKQNKQMEQFSKYLENKQSECAKLKQDFEALGYDFSKFGIS